MPLSVVPRFSCVRSAIGPCDSQANWSWMLMSKPMPVKVLLCCSCASKPQPLWRPKIGFLLGAGIGPEALAAHGVLVDLRAEAGEDRIPVAADVVDRHVELRDRHLGVHRDDE